MIAFKDFAPRQTQKQGFIKPSQWETLDQSVAVANEWIQEQKALVINVETVVVPGLWTKNEPKSAQANFSYGGSTNYSGQWFQFIRVWYTTE